MGNNISIKAILNRIYRSDQGTKGYLIFDNGLKASILELPWRNNKNNLSCIPGGDYLVTPYHSTKFGRCYLVNNVKDRDYILFHTGNFAGDSEKEWQTHSHGCLIVGSFFGMLKNKFGNNQMAVLASRQKFEYIISVLKHQPFELSIIKDDNFKEDVS